MEFEKRAKVSGLSASRQSAQSSKMESRWLDRQDNFVPSSASFPFTLPVGGCGSWRKWLQHCDKERNPMRVPDKWLMPLARGTFPRRNEGSS